MVTCASISTIASFADLLVWPTSCNYYFYLIIFEFLLGLFLWSSYKESEERIGLADILSSSAIASLVIVFLGMIGTLIKNSSSVPMIQSDIFLILIAQFIVLFMLWRFKK